MRKVIGKVTSQERDQIRGMFERYNGLKELAKIIGADNDDLYDKVVNDLGHATTAMEDWWSSMAEKYDWESTPSGHWEIDFSNCNIILCD